MSGEGGHCCKDCVPIGFMVGFVLAMAILTGILGSLAGCHLGNLDGQVDTCRRLRLMGVVSGEERTPMIKVNGVAIRWSSFLRADDDFLVPPPKKEEPKP